MSFKLASIETAKGPRAALVVGDRVIEVAAVTGREEDRTALGLLADWAANLPRLEAVAKEAASKGQALSAVKLLPPVTNPGAIYCAGANYADHAAAMAARSGSPPPADPHTLGLRSWHFMKSMNALSAPGATVAMQPHAKKIDWEAELAVVIGKKGRNISEADALEYVAGYTIANDLSCRDLGTREAIPPTSGFRHDWVAHKNWEGSCPLGPWMTLRNDVKNERDLKIILEINGVVKQDSNSGNMIFNINEQIADISKNITLHPGDVILTGTPSGVGAERGEFLKKGDVIKIRIGDLGELVTVMG
jgi:2-keto-4-pentenoate hydratase/2-oxohepta-3-ene-1,7-dioic acid hydratase in catechol pathway